MFMACFLSGINGTRVQTHNSRLRVLWLNHQTSYKYNCLTILLQLQFRWSIKYFFFTIDEIIGEKKRLSIKISMKSFIILFSILLIDCLRMGLLKSSDLNVPDIFFREKNSISQGQKLSDSLCSFLKSFSSFLFAFYFNFS